MNKKAEKTIKASNEESKEKCCPEILVVDDDENNIYALNLLLNILGFKSNWANNGELAIEMVIE